MVFAFGIDSEPVQGALAKGYPSREDLCELVGIFWNLALELRINLYIDRVPTDANPADPPSRDNLSIGSNAGWITLDPKLFWIRARSSSTFYQGLMIILTDQSVPDRFHDQIPSFKRENVLPAAEG